MPDRSVSWPYDIRKHFSLWRYFGRSLGRTCWFWSHGVENFLGCFGMYSLLGFGEGYPSAVLTCLSVDAVRGIHTNIINIEHASFNGFPPCYWIIWIMNLNPKFQKTSKSTWIIFNLFEPLAVGVTRQGSAKDPYQAAGVTQSVTPFGATDDWCAGLCHKGATFPASQASQASQSSLYVLYMNLYVGRVGFMKI